MLVTPELASEWLAELFEGQRPCRMGKVETLVRDMDAGRFKLGPDAILRIKGKTANGQHRLQAVVKSGKAQWFIVMESNDEELYKVIDAGLKRSVSDGIGEFIFASKIPSVARWVMAYEAGAVISASNSGANAKKIGVMSQSEMIDYCKSNSDILGRACSFVNPLYAATGLLPLSVAAAIFVIGENANKAEKTREFLKCLYIDGGPNAAGDLRNRLIANKGNKAKISSAYQFGISMKALKHFCNGTRTSVLKWVANEPFPEL